MSNDDQTQPVGPGEPAPEPSPTPAAGASLPPAPSVDDHVGDTTASVEPAPAGRRGFRERLRSVGRSNGRDRTFGLAALIASALAGIIVGGLGVTAVQAVGEGHDRDRGGHLQGDRGGERDGGFGNGPGGRDGTHGLLPGGRGQAPSDDGDTAG